MTAYRKHVVFLFDVDGCTYETTPPGKHNSGDWVIEVEEAAKNGQEDYHGSGVLSSVDGVTWQWEEESFSYAWGPELPEMILRFINENSPMKMLEGQLKT